MKFNIKFTDKACTQLNELKKSASHQKQLKAVRKTLGLMESNLRHPSLNTHEFTSMKGLKGEKIFESYAQNRTPSAYRVFWYYGPTKRAITVVSIVPHP